MFKDKLNEVIASNKSFMLEPNNQVGFGISLALNIIHWLVLYFKLKPGVSNVLLHYNVVLGSDLIGPGIYLYLVPATALILLIINWGLASSLYKKEKLASYFLAFATIAIQLIFLIAGIVLAVING